MQPLASLKSTKSTNAPTFLHLFTPKPPPTPPSIPYHSAMEMIPKNGENCKFHDLEKREMKAKWGDFGVKKQPLLRENSAYFALQCSLC